MIDPLPAPAADQAAPVPRLLLVEDSDTQALQFRRSIEPRGFSVDRTRSAEEALDRLNDTLPDLMVVDYRLPGMNGDELVRRVRQAGPTRTLPILMLTGDSATDLERQGLDSGANAYVPKGGTPDLLASRMRALLRQRTARSGGAASGGFRPARLLAIDDSATYRSFLRNLFSAEGYELLLAADGDAAAAMLAAHEVDCVLVALGSGSDRFATLATIEARRAQSGAAFDIVALAGDEAGETARQGLEAGADDVVPKGSDPEMLLVRIRATIRRKLARDEEMQGVARERERTLALSHARAQAEAADALAAANRDLAEANIRLQDTQSQLVQSAKMASLGELVAGIAHEINNPLAFILAHQSTVERAVADAANGTPEVAAARLAKATDRLASIRSGLVRIQDLVVKLRRFSRLDDNDAAELDVPEAIDAVLTLLAPRLAVGIAVERDYRAPSTLVCSAALINQVVMNIIANAADAVDPEQGRIRIATALDGGTYRIEIADNGPGVPEPIRARVFEPFFTTKDVGSGTGLGLAIAFGIVRAHGGEIAIDRGPEGGARFTISVPAAGL